MIQSTQTVNREADALQLMPEPRAWRGPSRPSLMDRLKDRLLERALRSLGPLHVERVALPGSPIILEVTRPGLTDGGEPGDLPLWADIWPSGVVLAGVIAREPGRVGGKRVLELGPGVGVTAAAALLAGAAELVLADSAQGALLLAARNARHHAGTSPRTLLINWRRPGEELYSAAGAGFDIVLAADILYEEKDVKPLIRLLGRVLAPDGEVWLAEPGRDPAEAFVAALAQRGWTDDREVCDSSWPDPHESTLGEVTVHRLRRPLLTPAR
jgi:predicted nicotinamide N-methyase